MDQLARLDPRLDFPGGSDGKATAYNAGDPGSIPGSGRCCVGFWVGKLNTLKYIMCIIIAGKDKGTVFLCIYLWLC